MLDDGTRSAHREPRAFPRNIHDAEVHIGREPLIEADLLQTKEPALFESGEIQKAKLYGPLDLVHERAREEQPGDVGLDEGHARRSLAGRVGIGLEQGLHDLRPRHNVVRRQGTAMKF